MSRMLLHLSIFGLVFLSEVICLIEGSPACPPCKSEDEETKSVCGSDGKVYPSLCNLKEVSCRTGTNLTSTEFSMCNASREDTSCPSICLRIQDPVCGEDGKIYPNECFMRQRNCEKPIAQKKMNFCFQTLRQSRRLEGLSGCPLECLEVYRPICGSDGEIYANHCRLRQKNCGLQKTDRVYEVPSTLCVSKPRCPKNCLPIPDPVCSSNGKIYLNQCQMLAQNCGKNVVRVSTEFCTSKAKDE